MAPLADVWPLAEYRSFLVAALFGACSVAIGQSPFALATSSRRLNYDLSLGVANWSYERMALN